MTTGHHAFDELIRQLRDLAAGKHDDLSVAGDGADAIQRLTEERDAALREVGSLKAALYDATEGISGTLLKDRVKSAEAERDRLRAALGALVKKLDEIKPHADDVFIYASVHGMKYRVPNWAEEMKTARAALTGEVKRWR